MHSHLQRALTVGSVVTTVLLTQGCSSLHPPVSEPQVAGFVARLGSELEMQQEPLIGPLTVEDAVARAVRYNHSVRAKELEASLADAKVRVQAGSMLPSIIAESDYYRRDRRMASRSNMSPTYSSSSDLQSISRDIALSWNLLDFGLSFVRSRQALDKAYQSHEEYRRVAARIAEETRSTYWRAVAQQKLAPALARLNEEVSDALKLARSQAKDPLIDPMVAINFQRDLLNSQRELNQVHASLAGATDQLKQLIGLPNVEYLRLSALRDILKTEVLSSSADTDIAAALQQRPEIRQHMYDLRITEEEVNVTILQLLPGVTLSKTFASDTNSFLLHHNWISWTSKIAGNLINLVKLPNDLATIDAQAEVHRANALATAATIVMQVHVARARLAVQMRSYKDAAHFAEAQQQLLSQTRSAVKTGKAGQQVLVREKLAMLLAEVRSIVSFADLHAAYGAYGTAKGDVSQQERGKTAKPHFNAINFIIE